MPGDIAFIFQLHSLGGIRILRLAVGGCDRDTADTIVARRAATHRPEFYPAPERTPTSDAGLEADIFCIKGR